MLMKAEVIFIIKKCNFKYKNNKNVASCVIAFGVGAMLSSFCPTGFLFFMAALIIVALGLMLRF